MGLFDFLKRTPRLPAEALVPWVHRTLHFQLLQQVRAREGRDAMLIAPVSDVFSMCIAANTDQGPIPVSQTDLDALGLDLLAAGTRCIQNVGDRFNHVSDAEGLYLWGGEDQLSPAMVMLAPLLASKLPLKGRPVVMVPKAELALMAGDDDEASLARMLDLAEKAFGDSKEYQSLKALHYPGGPLGKQWLPPEGHPLRKRFLAAAARTRKMEAAEAYQVHEQHAPAPLAALAALPASHGGSLVAAWFRDSNVLLPDVDKVVLLDTADGPLPYLEVDFAMLREELPAMFEELPLSALEGQEAAPTEDETGEYDEPAVFWRTRGVTFPSFRERAYLESRMRHEATGTRKERKVQRAELLAGWDGGEPVLVSSETLKRLRLRAPDGRWALTTEALLGERIEKLTARDQLALRTEQLTLLMFEALESLSGEHDEPTSEMPAAPPEDARASTQNLVERMQNERPLLIPSVKREAPKEDDLSELAERYEPARLYVQLRPPGYVGATRANTLGMVAHLVRGKDIEVKETQRLDRPFAEGVTLEVVSDSGDRMVTFNAGFFPEHLREPLWRTALLNLEAQSLMPLEPVAPGVFAATWDDGYDAARVLVLPRIATSCAVRGEPLVFAPTVGTAWVTGSDDLDGMRAALDRVDAHVASGDLSTPYQYREVLFGWPWVVREGSVQRWKIPDAHPLRPRIEALDAALAQRRTTSAEHVGTFAEAIYGTGEMPEQRE